MLVEALPYILRFWGKVVVDQVRRQRARTDRRGADGDGRRVGEAEALASFAEDVVLMRSVGHAPGGRARRWPADRRAHGEAGQGARVPRRHAGDRRRDARDRQHGPHRQGQPRDRVRHERARVAGGRPVGRRRQHDHGHRPRRVARLRRRRRGGRPLDPRSACWPRASSPWWRPSPATPRASPTTSTPTPWPEPSPRPSHAEKLVCLTDVDRAPGGPRRPELAAAHGSRSSSSTPWWRRGRRRRE